MACDFEQVDEYELSTECSLIYKGHTYKCRTEGRLPDCPLLEVPDEQPDRTAQERYEDLCEYFKDCLDKGMCILGDRKEFKAWLERVHWHVVTCDELGRELEKLKSAQPEQQWIPVSKKLPKEDVPVLVTDDAGGMATVGIDSCGRYEDTGERFWYTSQNVTAWMYTVEPYGGEQDEQMEI